jgi:hypothetical protein
MAENRQDHADAYGLTRDAAADVEDQEGPPMGTHHGETRTRIPEHADREGHGKKTTQHIRDEFSGRQRGGTH